MVEDRNYSAWHFIDSETFESMDLSNSPIFSRVDPAKHKLFSQDSILVKPGVGAGEDIKVEVIHSAIRSNPFIAGVLLLENNKTFGRTQNKKRLLYKCLPNDRHLPAFLVPYEIKVGFNKAVPNKYVVFRFDNWNDKHPQGILVEVIGDVNYLDAFYEYQIYCKSLYVSMTEFNEKARCSFKHKSQSEFAENIVSTPAFHISPQIKCVSSIFTIDPSNCIDYDDAFQLIPPNVVIDGNEPCENWRIKVYIANVFVWLETLGLWNAFTQRVSTIYLPDRRRPMLPSILADNVCSLRAGEDLKFVFSMTIEIDSASGKILDNTAVFKNENVKITKNYVYECPELLDNEEYSILFNMTKQIDPRIKDSHDIVSFWMVQMNRICGEKMANSRTGIFRAAFYLNKDLADIRGDIAPHLSEDTRRLIQNWNNTCGQYCVLNKADNDSVTDHEIMHLKNYIHITSPIRRLVDLLNQMIFMERFGMIQQFSQDAARFLNYWTTNIEYINSSMRSIRKVQTVCEVLRNCTMRPDILENTHAGVIFDKIKKNDGTYSYMVYLEKIKLLSRVNSCLDSWENYSTHYFKILVFEDEENVKRKIRLFPVSAE